MCDLIIRVHMIIIIIIYYVAEKGEDSAIITRHKPLKLITPCWLYTYIFKYNIIHIIVVHIYHVGFNNQKRQKYIIINI